jgi:asparagine synthase (glutamine-hydrolysing)
MDSFFASITWDTDEIPDLEGAFIGDKRFQSFSATLQDCHHPVNFKILWKEMGSKTIAIEKKGDWILFVCGFLRWLPNTFPPGPFLAQAFQFLEENKSLPQLMASIEGEFALLAVNTRMGAAYLVTDRIGHTSLYYSRKASLLICASHPNLVARAMGSLRLDPVGIQLYLSLKGIPAPWTLLEGVSKVQPGHIIEIDREHEEDREYWSLLDHMQDNYLGNLKDAQEELRELLVQAVRRSAGEIKDPTGIFLSGGLDSTVIMSTAHRSGLPLKAFSVGYVPSYRNDETKHARLAAQAFSIPLEIQQFTSMDIKALLEEILPDLPEPVADASFWPQLFLSRVACQQVKVVLDGTGADSLLGGSNKYLAEGYAQAYLQIPTWLRKSLIVPAINMLPASRRWKLTNMARLVQFLFAGLEQPSEDRELFWTRFMPIKAANKLLKTEFVNSADPGGKRLIEARQAANARQENLHSQRHISISSYITLKEIQPWVELLKLNAIERICGFSIRSPFLSSPLIEFCLRLPDPFKLHNRQGKFILREAVTEWVPDEIIKRQKANFSPPVDRWLCQVLYSDFLEAFAAQGPFIRNEVLRLFSLQRSGWRDWQSELWAIYVLQRWWISLGR